MGGILGARRFGQVRRRASPVDVPVQDTVQLVDHPVEVTR